MSKKKSKTRVEKATKRHDFSHLLKTKVAAKIVEAESEISKEIKSPLQKEIKRDLLTTAIILGIFVTLIVVLWLFLGRNGEIFKLTDKIKLF